LSARRFKPLVAKLTLLGLTLVVILVMLEIGTRVVTGQPPPMYENDPVLGKIYRSNASTWARIPECDCRVFLRFNRDGLRGEDRPYEKPPGVRRVAVLGDSMIAAVATEEENTAVGVLEDLLNRSDPSVAWEVLSFGVSGSSTGQELVLYRELAWRYEPDVVLGAFFVGNDFADNSRRLTSSGHRIYFDLDERGTLVQLPRSTRRSNVSAWLNRHSRLYVWQKGAFRGVRNRLRKASGELPNSDLVYWTRPTGDAAHAWRLLESLIGALKSEVESRGSQFAMAVLPAGPQVMDDHWDRLVGRAGDLHEEMDLHYPERRLGEICERVGIPLVTMVDDFRAAAPHNSSEYDDEVLHYRGSGHFNDAGNRLTAEVLYRFLTDKEPLAVRDRPDA
jgi:hypothetical protein